MTASKLEESIEKLAEGMVPLINAQSCGLRDYIRKALRAFAEAVRECNCACNKKQEPQKAIEANESLMGKGREPKECPNLTLQCSCGAKAKHPPTSPAALPDEVKLMIRETAGDWDADDEGLQESIEAIARLCLSLRKP